ncbi:MAG: UDP-N-acetylmuramoyl-tripeptide--D-alanyl-D-alanine ligase [Oscillospiraceae bacterium]|nr:UDP-N-acetylmuramoyl-tripeptide--D-alanyl-D-alanine ligase [Oscillospiraceae bacterium]
MTIQEMLAACGGQWLGRPELLERTPDSIVVDSRQAREGSLFIALHGERTDGHKYIPDVLQKGALAVLCEEPGTPGEPRLLVPDVMEAMRAMARANRKTMSIPFVGVTGSVGKTTAKEMIAAALSGRWRTYKTPGSMNGQIGLPVSLMGLDKSNEAAVIEMGISHFGEMRRLTEVVRPDIAVFTNIGDAHLEFLRDRAGVLRAKSEILEGMGPEGLVVANGDDALLSRAAFGRKTVLFGLSTGCDVRAEEIDPGDGTELRCRIVTDTVSFSVCVPAYGQYMIYSVLAAAAVGLALGESPEEIAQGMESYRTVGHRSRVIKTARFTVVDDCYNANPSSNRAAIDSLLTLPGRKVCILGDMREMGEESPRLHREIGEYAREKGIELILTEGEEAAFIARGAGEIAQHFPDRASLLAALPSWLKTGDAILIKASHGPRFDDIVEAVEKL